jgi:hypothetical protein
MIPTFPDIPVLTDIEKLQNQIIDLKKIIKKGMQSWNAQWNYSAV